MVSFEDRCWINRNYSFLTVDNNSVVGKVYVVAEYNPTTNLFNSTPSESANDGWFRFARSFVIALRKRHDDRISKLPALFVDGIKANANRHFNIDGSACLCSPFTESEYFSPEFLFSKYFQELIIPFLYAQMFYERYQRWPWAEFSHGSPGILESFFQVNSSTAAVQCILSLSKQTNWNTIKDLLLSDQELKRDIGILGDMNNHGQAFHPTAWFEGLRKLKVEVDAQNLKSYIDSFGA